ncbi:MAG: DNA internalization-related competence protein ComEC/Rec2 [Planctomycetes bacterium]|nr:DNA internalization-related competence protein ComEC/Rec2 [Planctomycetota bacterium]
MMASSTQGDTRLPDPTVAVNRSALALTPILPWGIGIIIGIALESRTFLHPLLCLVVILACGILAAFHFIRARAGLILILVAAISFGALRHHAAFRAISTDDTARLVSGEKTLAKVAGTISTPPQTRRTGYEPFEPWLHRTDQTWFILRIENVNVGEGPQQASGLVRVTISEPTLAPQEGDRVEVSGWLSATRPPRNPGQRDWSLYNARHGIRTQLRSPRAENINVLHTRTSHSNPLANHFRKLLLGASVDSGDESATLLDTMVLGHRSAVDEEVERLFIDTGCAHYLAVSGIHIAMLASLVWFPARFLGADRRMGAALVIASVVLYVTVADARPSMLRAAVMACSYGFALLLRRRGSVINTLAFAASLLLAIDPLSLFDIGFQLSFIAVLGIVLLSPIPMSAYWYFRGPTARAKTTVTSPAELDLVLQKKQHTSTVMNGILRWAGTLICVSIAAWVSTLPIIALHFGRCAPIGWLHSFIAFPFVFGVMAMSFLKLAVGLLLPFIAQYTNSPLEFTTQTLRNVLSTSRDIFGGPIEVTPPAAYTICAYYVGLLAIVYYFRRGWSRRGIAIVLVLATFVVASWCWPRRTTDALAITQLAVGRGTSTVIELPNGNVWLYDAGSSSPSDPGKNTILPLLRHRSIRQLDGIIISHANLDHFGGVPSVLKDKRCDVVYLNTTGKKNAEERDTPFDTLCNVLRDMKQDTLPLRAGDTLDWGEGVTAQILWPPTQTPAHLDANDRSIVVKILYAGKSVLLTGDIGFAAQQRLIENEDIGADVLILPHHGAVEDNTAAFIRIVGPKHLIRSSFVKNSESPKLQRAAGMLHIYNTADVGSIEITLTDDGIKVSPFLPPKS